DGDGAFALDGLPRAAGAIEFQRDGFVPQRLDTPKASAAGQRIVLARIDAGPIVVSGRVLDQSLVPIADALVGLQDQLAHPDAAGAFRLVFARGRPGLHADSRLFAAYPGLQTLVLERFGARLRDAGSTDLVLQLVDPVLSIAGRVVDADGRPVAGAVVYPWD